MTIRVCFVAINAYPVIDPSVPGSFGGIETRSWMLAKALATHPDFEVSFLVRHSTRLRTPVVAGVKLYLLRDRFYQQRVSLLMRLQRCTGFPWMRLRQPRLSDMIYLPLLLILKLLRKRHSPLAPEPTLANCDADLFVTFGVQNHSARIIATAREKRVPSILFLGSDGDIDENYLLGKTFTNVYRDQSDVCYWILKNADHILCQTPLQQERLSRLFQRESHIIKNPIDVEEWDRLQQLPLNPRFRTDFERYALWVGRADPVHKRPQDLIELARRCPDVSFLMVMNRRDDLLEREIKTNAPANVRIIDHVPFEQIPALFAKATLLINTSELEGFPNTFLQAALSEVPIVSLNVEEEFLRKTNAGYCANGSLTSCAELINKVWQGSIPQPTAREHVIQAHDLSNKANELSDYLKHVIKS